MQRGETMGVNVTFQDNSGLYKNAAKEAIERALEAVGQQAVSHAKRNLIESGAVDTGRLREQRDTHRIWDSDVLTAETDGAYSDIKLLCWYRGGDILQKALIAMSGGVDSAVAAKLMQERGFECVGCTMVLWGGDDAESKCCSRNDVEDARYVARMLGIPHYVFNLREDFSGKSLIPSLPNIWRGGRRIPASAATGR
jgi:predicted PP-loop superfamily ATPase